MKLIQCKRCGGELKEENGRYVCAYCHARYEDDTLERAYAELKNSLENLVGEQIEENAIRERERSLANLRRELWDKTHEKYANSKAIVKICREIKKIDADDFMANFYETMNDESEDCAQVTEFLDEIDVQKQEDYIDDVVEFVVKSLKIEYLTSLNMLVERAYKSDKLKYGEMMTKIEEEAEKVEEGLYALEQPRDVFVAYSSKDVKRVNELVRYLEEQGIQCFVALRNLQQGAKSVENYQKALETAMDNCKVFLFVSSKNSRSLGCDAIKRELPYVKRRDLEFKPEYRNNYEKMPEKYRKPRIQYRIDDERTPATDRQIQEFFGTLQWRYDLDSVSAQIGEYLNQDIYEEDAPTPSSDRENLYEEFKKRMREEEARKAEELRQAEEKKQAEERRQEELRKVEEQRKAEETRRVEELRQAEEARRAEELRKAKESASSDFEIENGVLKKYKGKGGDVVIPDGVTEIGEDSFNACENLTSVVVSKTVIKIGYRAFKDCKNLTNATIPNSVTEIAMWAFEGCESLERIKIPNSITEINPELFTGCKNLTSIEIPSSVTDFSPSAFDYCSKLTSLTVENGNTVYYSKNNCIIEKANNRLMLGCETSVIPDDIQKICAWAFKGRTGLKSIVIPTGVTYIGVESFAGCSGLTSVTIPDGVTTIDDGVFENCESLTNVTIPKSVKTIGDSVFKGCKNLISVTLPNELESISHSIFFDCLRLTNVKIPDATTEIRPCAFCGCESLTHIEIPKSVEEIGFRAFQDCKNLTIYAEESSKPSGWVENWNPDNRSVVWGYKNKQANGNVVKQLPVIAKAPESESARLVRLTEARRKINQAVFPMDGGTLTGYKGKSEIVDIPYGITSIGKDAFLFSKTVKTVIIPDSVKIIEKGAFFGCKNLTSVTLGKGVKSIGVDAFMNCKSLETIDMSNTPIERIEKSAFNSCKLLKEVILPQGLKTIDKNAFYACKALEKVVIPKSVEVIEDTAFMNSPNLTIYAEASKKPVGWVKGGLWKNWNFDDRPVVWDYKGK